MSVINATPLLAATGGDYQISRSVRLRSSASAYFNRTPTSTSNTKTWTWSGWIKRGALASGTYYEIFGAAATSATVIYFVNDNFWFQLTDAGGTTIGNISTTAVFRDPSAWYHVVAVLDTTQATSTNRCKVYINGVQQTLTFTITPSQNADARINNSSYAHSIGGRSTLYFDGYLTEVNFIDGQALTPSSFGETDVVTGVWKPKKYTGTYGTNGFYLNFSDNSAATAAAIGKDYSGNGNNWTPNNISVTAGATYDSMLDVPTPYADGGNGRGNYAVLNPLLSTGGVTANANLQVTTTVGVGHSRATIPMPASGKWYAEFTAVSASTGTDYIFGIVGADTAEASYGYTQTPSYSYSAFGERIVNNTFTASFYSSYTTGDVIGCAVDLDTNQLTWYKNGTAQTAISIANGSYFWIVSDASGSRQITAAANFGQRPFAYTPPTGFKALNTQNLPEPTIKKGNQYFDVVLYTGNAVQDRAVTGFGFDLDFAWIKSRSNAGSHVLVNRVVGGDKQLFSNLTNAEQTNADVTNGFTTGGILVGDNLTGTGSTNQSGYTYAFSGWKANGTGVSNTDGSITSTVSANTTAGFSIVTYTGTGANATVGHGLGVAPKMVIIKQRNGTGSWVTWHNSFSPSYRLDMETTNSLFGPYSTFMQDTVPSSSVVYLGTNGNYNAASSTYVAYCFAEVEGFSKFGKYTGNGSADGPFVFCGFRPRWVMIKRTDSTGRWEIIDTSRDVYNTQGLGLAANYSNAESTPYWYVDFLSNGFKLRHSDVESNANGGTYIFMAFAENPFANSLAR